MRRIRVKVLRGAQAAASSARRQAPRANLRRWGSEGFLGIGRKCGQAGHDHRHRPSLAATVASLTR